MLELTSSQRRTLRARAHGLHPVVSISQKGLSDAVLAEIDRSLKAHELIKVRVYGAERAERETLLAEICVRLEAAPIQHIGNIIIVYRHVADEVRSAAEPGAPEDMPSSRRTPARTPKHRPPLAPLPRAKTLTPRRRKP